MLHRPDRKTVVPIVVVLRIDSATVEVQVPSVAGRPIAVAGAGEESLKPEFWAGVLLCSRLSPIRHHGRTPERATVCLYFFTPTT